MNHYTILFIVLPNQKNTFFLIFLVFRTNYSWHWALYYSNWKLKSWVNNILILILNSIYTNYMKTTIVLYLSQTFWPSYTIPLDLLTLLFNRSNVMNSRKKNSILIHDEELFLFSNTEESMMSKVTTCKWPNLKMFHNLKNVSC